MLTSNPGAISIFGSATGHLQDPIFPHEKWTGWVAHFKTHWVVFSIFFPIEAFLQTNINWSCLNNSEVTHTHTLRPRNGLSKI